MSEFSIFGPGILTFGTSADRGLVRLGAVADPSTQQSWTGLGADTNWTTALNWDGGVVPVGTDIVAFGLGSVLRDSQVDSPQIAGGLFFEGSIDHNLFFENLGSLDLAGDMLLRGTASDAATLRLTDAVSLTAFVSNFQIGFGSSGGTSAVVELSSSAILSIFGDALDIARLTGTANGSATGSLILGDASLTLGREDALAALNIAFNEKTGFGSSSSNGLLDASDPNAILDLNLSDLRVGYSTFGRGTNVGTLRWDQSEILHANNVFFGHGSATGLLELVEGGTFYLGSDAQRVGLLQVGSSNGGNAVAQLDFTQVDAEEVLFLDALDIARLTGAANGSATGSLILGDASLTLGREDALAALNIAFNEKTGFGSSSSNGLLDASDPNAILNLNLSDLRVGYSNFGRGTNVGTLRTAENANISAQTASLGFGNATAGHWDFGGGSLVVGADGQISVGTFSLFDGSLTGAELVITDPVDFDMSSGVLRVDAVMGDLVVGGGILSAGASGQTAIAGDLDLQGDAVLALELPAVLPSCSRQLVKHWQTQDQAVISAV